MKSILLIAIMTFALTSCSRLCDPQNIRSGKSSQHLDSKKFRVMWVRQYGNYCKVRLMNMRKQFNAVCLCDCDTLPVGKWITVN
jgi:hypothetical protein